MNDKLEKRELREKMIQLRASLSESEINSMSISLLEKLKVLPIWAYKSYHIFLPIATKKEINTYPIIQYLWDRNKQVSVPKVNTVKNLIESFIFKKGDRLKKNRYGVEEPIEEKIIPTPSIEVLFIPLLGCDEKGYRVGYGKGFYDDFLAHSKRGALKIGLSFFAPIKKIEDIRKEDIGLNRLVTPFNTYEFLKE